MTTDLWVEIYCDEEGKWERIMAPASIVGRPFLRHPRRSAGEVLTCTESLRKRYSRQRETH